MSHNAHAGPVRRGGTALLTPRSGPPAPSTRPQRAGLLAPAPSLARWSPTSPPRSHAPLAELGAAPRCLWERRERPQSKRSKEDAEELGPGSCGLAAWRWWCTERLRRLRGSRVALGLTPLAASLPSPSRLPVPSHESSFLLPSGLLRSGAGLSPSDVAADAPTRRSGALTPGGLGCPPRLRHRQPRASRSPFH